MSLDDSLGNEVSGGVNYEVRLSGVLNKLRFGASFPNRTGGMTLPECGKVMHCPSYYGNDGKYVVSRIKKRGNGDVIVYVKPVKLRN